jgi:hypothetical protein
MEARVWLVNGSSRCFGRLGGELPSSHLLD